MLLGRPGRMTHGARRMADDGWALPKGPERRRVYWPSVPEDAARALHGQPRLPPHRRRLCHSPSMFSLEHAARRVTPRSSPHRNRGHQAVCGTRQPYGQVALIWHAHGTHIAEGEGRPDIEPRVESEATNSYYLQDRSPNWNRSAPPTSCTYPDESDRKERCYDPIRARLLQREHGVAHRRWTDPGSPA